MSVYCGTKCYIMPAIKLTWGSSALQIRPSSVPPGHAPQMKGRVESRWHWARGSQGSASQLTGKGSITVCVYSCIRTSFLPLTHAKGNVVWSGKSPSRGLLADEFS